MNQFSDASFWLALGQLAWVNNPFSGDKPNVTARAARMSPDAGSPIR